MPHCFIEVPEKATALKAQAAERVTAALKEAYQFRADFGVWFREYSANNTAYNGKLGGDNYPLCYVDGPSLSAPAKRRLVQEISAAVAEAFSAQKILVFVREHALENVGFNGELISDTKEAETIEQLVA